MTDVFILSAKRTPIGSFLGALASVPATRLGSIAMRAAVDAARIEPASVEEVFFGNVLSAGLGQAPARQAALGAGIGLHAPATTVSKVCGSGLQAVVLAARTIATRDAAVAIAGGMESMSRVPHYLPTSRVGQRLGHAQLIDGMLHDGLLDPESKEHMGVSGELCAKKFELSRSDQDAFAAESYRRARRAQDSGLFDAELCPVPIVDRRQIESTVDRDEEPERGRPERFANLAAAFAPTGTITAANASSLSDGSAALVLAGSEFVGKAGCVPLARIVSTASFAQEPRWFTTAPAYAIERALARAGLGPDDIDLYEINEAFSCVTMACSTLAGIDPERVNVHGGAVALGHPIGATGARILVTLVHALHARKARRGLATLCIGGGEAVAVIVERV